jgi:hypothetical protein
MYATYVHCVCLEGKKWLERCMMRNSMLSKMILVPNDATEYLLVVAVPNACSAYRPFRHAFTYQRICVNKVVPCVTTAAYINLNDTRNTNERYMKYQHHCSYYNHCQLWYQNRLNLTGQAYPAVHAHVAEHFIHRSLCTWSILIFG